MPKLRIEAEKQVLDIVDQLVLRNPELMQEDLTSAVTRIRSSILNYCRIPIQALVPDELEEVWIEAALQLHNASKAADGLNQRIKSISEGDTTIQYESGSETVTLQSIINSYSNELNQYRRLFPW
ncbi:hypothetical protein DWY25_00905 [Holdemania filiformis]|uniref:Uncharacterized protein n=1 Tax=Holdemania filiformis TaxID=61171 RepID=A0A412G6F6_9FIRM|nr:MULTISPECIES: hypothetical protein [Holdemania]MCH1941593.1 hypothetical protein [Holdemania massiliensis]RGR76884.1 hypothetical protein DWY25_00905 [Holdemania filiformis]